MKKNGGYDFNYIIFFGDNGNCCIGSNSYWQDMRRGIVRIKTGFLLVFFFMCERIIFDSRLGSRFFLMRYAFFVHTKKKLREKQRERVERLIRIFVFSKILFTFAAKLMFFDRLGIFYSFLNSSLFQLSKIKQNVYKRGFVCFDNRYEEPQEW